MAKLAVVDLKKNKVGDVDVSDDVFGAPMNSALLWEVVKWQQALKRQGTHATKRRGEVHGTNKKPYGQKHTGRARMGDVKTPLKVGGAIVFGPQPRSYAFHVNKKVKQGALRVALSQLVKENRLVVVRNWDVKAPKTKDAQAALKALGLDRGLLVDVNNPNLKKSISNLHTFKYLSQPGVNVYDVLKFGHMVITEPALKALETRLQG
ncbi:MAG: 50S ribosomal protein L4 [Myxococcota bacterium]